MIYDIAIIGAGPAGMTAALYGMRAGMKVLLLEKAFPGGQMVSSNQIENYPGFVGISGAELAMNMKNQLTDITYKTMEIITMDLSGTPKKISSAKEEFLADNIVIASGATPKKLGIPNEDKLIGRGVSYCATCDGALYKGKITTVIGGGNTALEDALYLANFCEQVNLVHRRNEFRGDLSTLSKIKANDKIKIYTEYIPVELIGTDGLNEVVLKHTTTEEKLTLKTDGLFVAIGYQPNVSFLPEGILKSESNEVITDKNCMTNLDHVYAIGDVRRKELRQIVTACSDGAEVVSAIRRKANV
ncbi:MAG: FAD-dependent oxidoreductase [Clostridia bacterium]|nr:FAD-dependent oxidoreductase [Clostridia bacterium]